MKDQEQKLTRQQRRAEERRRGERASNNPPTISLAETRLREHSAIIEKEAKSREITPIKAENLLWLNPSPSLESSDTVAIMEQKLSDMLSRIDQSQNSHFKTALEAFVRLRDTKGLRTLVLQGNPRMAMAAEIEKTEDGTDTELRLVLSDEGISLINHPLNLASVFVHELEHLRDIEEFDEEMQELPLDERLSRHWERSTNPVLFRAMEARATGVQYEALIHHFGMIQAVPEYIPLKEVEFVADYIKTSCDPLSPRWLKATAAHEAQGLVSIPREY